MSDYKRAEGLSAELFPLPQNSVLDTVTGLISLIYEKSYNLMEVLYIFPMIFKVKQIFNPI